MKRAATSASTRGAGRDNNLVQDEHDHEDDAANHKAAANHEFAKRADDRSRRFDALIAIEQNQTGRGHVEARRKKGCGSAKGTGRS